MKTADALRFSIAISILALFCFSIAAPVSAAPTLLPNLARTPDEMEVQTALDAILADLAKQREALIKIQRELVRLPAINPEDGGDGEEAKVRWIESWLAAEGLPPAERVDCPDAKVKSGIRPSLILRHSPHQPDRPTLWIVNHLDNSPPGDIKSWTASPFTLRVDGDWMYGSGVQDNNEGIAASLLLLRALHRNKAQAPLNLGVLMTAGEKKGDWVGFINLMEKRPGLLRRGDQFLVTSYGEKDGDAIEIGEKGILWLKIVVQGRQGHAAFPTKSKNALTIGAELIISLSSLAERFPAADALFVPPVSTFIPTKAESLATAINQISGEFVFYMDARVLPQYTLEEVRAAIKELADEIARKHGVTIHMERIIERPAAPNTSPDAPVVAALSRAIERQLGRQSRLIGVGGGTSAAELRRLGYPAVVWQILPIDAYSIDESMSIIANLAEASVMARLLFDPTLASAASGALDGDRVARESSE